MTLRALVSLLFLGFFVVALVGACDSEGPSAVATATPVAPDPTTTPTPPAIATRPPPSGNLTVTPSRGAVGDGVTIRASDLEVAVGSLDFFCFHAGAPGEGKTVAGFANVFQLNEGSEARADFEVSWTIPDTLQPVQGEGGGPTPIDGDCRFETSPPGWIAAFEVVAQ
jgi:hypothetical protein